MVVNGSLSKTAVNGGAGAKSQLSGLFVALLTILTLLFLTGLFAYLPETVLAAVVIAAVLELVDVAAMLRLYRVVTGPLRNIYGPAARADFIAALAAMLGVMVFDTLPGLFIGIIVSVVLLVYRASRPHVAELGLDPADPDRYLDLSRHPSARATAGIVILRIESGLFFANADSVESVIRAAADRPGTRAVILDAESVPSVDVSAADMVEGLRHRLEDHHVRLVIAREFGQVHDVFTTAEPGRRALDVYPTVLRGGEGLHRRSLSQRLQGVTMANPGVGGSRNPSSFATTVGSPSVESPSIPRPPPIRPSKSGLVRVTARSAVPCFGSTSWMRTPLRNSIR